MHENDLGLYRIRRGRVGAFDDNDAHRGLQSGNCRLSVAQIAGIGLIPRSMNGGAAEGFLQSGYELDVKVRGGSIGEGLVVGGFFPGVGDGHKQSCGQAGLANPGLIAHDLNDGHEVSCVPRNLNAE